jgi:hypothetical protein
MHRLLLAAAALVATATPAFAQTTCKLEHAIYAERENGYEIRFRVPKTGELMGMTESLFDLVTPDGRKLWGEIAGNMGTSRDVGRVYYGCQKPKPGGPHLTDEQIADCQQWEGVVYAMNKGEPGFMPMYDAPAPERILLSDLGRQIRYSPVGDGPSGEPWDVFDFKRCAK